MTELLKIRRYRVYVGGEPVIENEYGDFCAVTDVKGALDLLKTELYKLSLQELCEIRINNADYFDTIIDRLFKSLEKKNDF